MLLIFTLILMAPSVRSQRRVLEMTKMPSSSTVGSENSENVESTDLERPIYTGHRYENPRSFNNWDGLPGPRDLFRYKFLETDKSDVPDGEEELEQSLPVHNLTSFEGTSKLFAAWLGHATMLVQMEGARFLTDPIWASRASPISFAGPKRFRPPPMKISNLPSIDFAVISHDHYDHLDQAAVLAINKQNPNMRWFVPMGIKDWMKSIGIKNSESNRDRVTEMTWGDSTTFDVRGNTYEVHCLPTQHWGQRGLFDRNKRLWSGWSVFSPSKKFYYSGDTGYCDKEFKKIGEKFGPFDLAAIPIGAYEPRYFMKSQHINPDEAVGLHELIKSKFSIGIHWGTYYMGSYEHYLEPRNRLRQLMAERKDLPPFTTIDMGEIWEASD